MTETLEQLQEEIKSLDDRRLELETKARQLREQQRAEESAAREEKNERIRNNHYALIDDLIEKVNRSLRDQRLNLKFSRSDNSVKLSIFRIKYATPRYEYKLGKVEEVLAWIEHIFNYADAIDELLFRREEFASIEVSIRNYDNDFFIRGYFKERTSINTTVYFTITFEQSKIPNVYLGTDLVSEASYTRIPIGNDLYLSTEVENYEDHFFVSLDTKKNCSPSEIIPFLTESYDKILAEVENRKDGIPQYAQ